MATPSVAGAASLLYNYYTRVLVPGQIASPAMLKALLINSARYMSGTFANDDLPSNNQGYGEVNMGTLFTGTSRLLTDQSQLLTATGQTFTQSGVVSDSTKPFRITLAYTDAPGATTGAAYVNNLDLEVTVGAQTYKGNVFVKGASVPGGVADAKNNVESVFLPAGVTGPFTVTVKALTLAAKGVPSGLGTVNQDFALVVTNGQAAVSTATLTHISPASGRLRQLPAMDHRLPAREKDLPPRLLRLQSRPPIRPHRNPRSRRPALSRLRSRRLLPRPPPILAAAHRDGPLRRPSHAPLAAITHENLTPQREHRARSGSKHLERARLFEQP